MPNELTTKRSLIVLMWKFAIAEAVGGFFYFMATLLGNIKYELYTHLSFQNFLSYQLAKLLLLSFAQFALTIYAFLSWYYEDYIVRPDAIVHTSGVFKRKEKVFPINKSTMLTISTSWLGKLFHYGSVHVENGGSSIVLASVSSPERVMKALQGGLEFPILDFGEKPDLLQLLDEAEHDQLEFKSSLRFDYKARNVSKELERATMKTVAAFLNSKGGYLILGISDARKPLGLQNDYQTLQRKDSDGFENHFTQSFNSMVGPEFRDLIKLWFLEMDGFDVCIIQALPSPRPVYLKTDNDEHFYIRTGNISTALKLSEIESYSRSRWLHRTN